MEVAREAHVGLGAVNVTKLIQPKFNRSFGMLLYLALTRKDVPKMKSPAKIFVSYIAVSLLTWGPPATAADAGDFEAAYGLCGALKRTGVVTECTVKSGLPASVNFTINTNSSEARKMCDSTVALANKASPAFLATEVGWEVRISSPYSNGRPIAVCSLNRNNSKGMNR